MNFNRFNSIYVIFIFDSLKSDSKLVPPFMGTKKKKKKKRESNSCLVYLIVGSNLI